MGGEISDLEDWFQTPPGRYLLQWEQAQFDQAVVDSFGFHALQLGLPALKGLQANRIPHQWLASSTPSRWSQSAQLVTDFAAMPFAENSMDLLLLPHALELGADPHAALREAERVLVPEGRVVISGLNPTSLWGARQRRGHLVRRWGGHWGQGPLFLPQEGEFIGYWRLRDWLRLLGFEVETARFGCYRPAVQTEHWLQRFAWMDGLGRRWWPIFGAVYFVVAVKKVRGMRLITPGWRKAGAPARATAPVAQLEHTHRGESGAVDRPL